jgi:hypothetical protein
LHFATGPKSIAYCPCNPTGCPEGSMSDGHRLGCPINLPLEAFGDK